MTDDSATRRSTSVRVSAQGDRSFYYQGSRVGGGSKYSLGLGLLMSQLPSSNDFLLFIPGHASAHHSRAIFCARSILLNLSSTPRIFFPLRRFSLSKNFKTHAAPSALHLSPRRALAVRHGIPKEGIDVCPFHVSSYFRSFLPSA
jgi:hypothetical protein